MAAEESSSSSSRSSSSSTVNIRCTNGSKFCVQADLSSTTIASFKPLLVQGSGVAADQQRLIYKGRVLRDDSTLESYGVQDGHTIHLVRAAPSSEAATVAAAGSAAATNSVSTPPTNALSGGLNGFGTSDVFGLGNLGGGGGTGLGLPEFQQVQQQLMQNPNLMRDMMNMPAVQSLMNNPEMMRSLILNNPQMRSLIDRNPELGHILNDPSTLRQTLDAARNPELMREMMRNTDRAMSNIEASPEGFNMLRRMYETVEEPFLNAATGGDAAGNAVGAANNPFAALFGTQGQPTQPANRGTGTETIAPNTAPLPNPWNPTQNTAAAGAPGQIGMGTRANTMGLGGNMGLGFPLPDLGDAGGMGLMDPAAMQQMLQNPAVLQMLRNLVSDPQYMNQIANVMPPEFREMMQNPDFLRQITSPEVLQDMLTFQAGQQTAQNPTANGAATGAPRPIDVNSLLGLFGTLGGGRGGGIPEVNTVPPEQLYATQLSQLQAMGFIDTEANISALRATGGNVHAAVERLLGG